MQRCYRCHHYFKKPIFLRHLASFIQLNKQVLLQVFSSHRTYIHPTLNRKLTYRGNWNTHRIINCVPLNNYITMRRTYRNVRFQKKVSPGYWFLQCTNIWYFLQKKYMFLFLVMMFLMIKCICPELYIKPLMLF